MEELRKLIDSKGLKLYWLAKQINKQPCEMSIWLNGKRKMPDHIKLKLMEIIEGKNKIPEDIKGKLLEIIDEKDKIPEDIRSKLMEVAIYFLRQN